MRNKLFDKWVNTPIADYLLSLSIVAAVAVLETQLNQSILKDLSTVERQNWLGTLAGVCGSLLGLSITAVTILFAVTPGPKLGSLLAEAGSGVNLLMLASLKVLALITVLFALLIPFQDLGCGLTWSLFIVGLFNIAVLRIGRVFWILSRVTTIFVREAEETQTE